MTLGFKIAGVKKDAVLIKVGRITKVSSNFKHLITLK